MRLVCFDFWQTLLADTPESGAAAHALRLAGVGSALAEAGFRYDAAALEAADVRALGRLTEIWGTHRDVPPARQVAVFLEALDPDLPAAIPAPARAAVEVAYGTPVLTHGPVPVPGAVAAVRALAGLGLSLAVISNTGRTPGTVLRRLLAAAGLLEAFRVLSFSDEVGVRKPDPGIFRRTLAEAGCPPEAAIHVGDDPVSDVAGARGAGMRAVHYVAPGRPAAEHADVVVRDLTELPGALARLG